MPAASAAGTRWVLVLACAALLGAIVLVRPGVAARESDLRTDLGAPLDLDRLRVTSVVDLPVTGSGIGPLQLGLGVEELLAAGWGTPFPAAPGARCARLPRVTVDGGVLTGWASGDVVVSAQLEADDPAAHASTVGSLLGMPVDGARATDVADARGPAPTVTARTVAGESGTAEVGTARWRLASSDVVASDLGGDGVRAVEVAAPDGARCRLTPDVLAAEHDAPYPSEAAAAEQAWQTAAGRLGRVRAGADPTLVGLAGAGVAVAGVDRPDDPCGWLPGATRLLQSGAVVTGERPEGAEHAVPPPPGRLYGLASGTLARTTTAQLSDAGVSDVVTLLTVDVSSVLLEEVDAFAVVGSRVRQVAASGCA